MDKTFLTLFTDFMLEFNQACDEHARAWDDHASTSLNAFPIVLLTLEGPHDLNAVCYSDPLVYPLNLRETIVEACNTRLAYMNLDVCLGYRVDADVEQTCIMGDEYHKIYEYAIKLLLLNK